MENEEIRIEVVKSVQGFDNYKFTGKLTEEIKSYLKENGYFWSRRNQCYYPATDEAKTANKTFTQKLESKFFSKKEASLAQDTVQLESLIADLRAQLEIQKKKIAELENSNKELEEKLVNGKEKPKNAAEQVPSQMETEESKNPQNLAEQNESVFDKVTRKYSEQYKDFFDTYENLKETFIKSSNRPISDARITESFLQTHKELVKLQVEELSEIIKESKSLDEAKENSIRYFNAFGNDGLAAGDNLYRATGIEQKVYDNGNAKTLASAEKMQEYIEKKFNELHEKENEIKDEKPSQPRTKKQLTKIREKCREILEKLDNSYLNEKEKSYLENEIDEKDENDRNGVEATLRSAKFIYCTKKDKDGYWDEEHGKEITANEARKMLSMSDFVSALDRACFHWTSGRSVVDKDGKETGYIAFDDSDRDRTVPPYELTKEDLQILSQYEGAGGLNEANRSVNGVLNEFYTPQNLVDKVWKIVDHYAPDAKTVLEPSSGIGKFAVNRPQNEFTMHEIDETSARIAKILHPDANVVQSAYQKQFFDEGGRVRKSDFVQPKYDVVIGNPPYGKYNDIYKGLGEGKEFDRYEEYFISKGLDALKDKKSVLAFVVPSGFLKSAEDNQKKIIAEKGQIIDAYRLPEGTFGTTDVGTDIIVMRSWDEKKQKLNERAKGNAAYQKAEFESWTLNEAWRLSGDQWFKNHPEKILGKTVEFTDRFGKPATKVVAEDGMTVQDELDKIDGFVAENLTYDYEMSEKEFANFTNNLQHEEEDFLQGKDQEDDELASGWANEDFERTQRLNEIISEIKKSDFKMKVSVENNLRKVVLTNKNGDEIFSEKETGNPIMPIASNVAAWAKDVESENLKKLADEYFNIISEDGVRGGDYVNKVFGKEEEQEQKIAEPKIELQSKTIDVVNKVEKRQETEKELALTQDELSLAESVIPEAEYNTMLEYAAAGEESDFYKQKIKDIAAAVQNAPKMSETDGQDEHKIVLRYFHPAGTEAYITEIGENGEAFGFQCLNNDCQNAEWGILDINEIKKIPMMETDLYVQDGMTVERYLGKEHPEVFPEYAELAEKTEQNVANEIVNAVKQNIETSRPLGKIKLISEEEQLKDYGIKAEAHAKYFVKSTAEFEQFADFEPITNLTGEEAVAKYKELQEKGVHCGIGINIEGDRVFDDKNGNGITVLVRNNEGCDTLNIYGDSFVKNLKERGQHSFDVLVAFDSLYRTAKDAGLDVEDAPYISEKENELFGNLFSQNQQTAEKREKSQKSNQTVTKSKGEVMTAEEFSHLYGRDFDEREFPIWKATDWQGNIDLSKLTDADKAYLSESKNYVQKNFGEWTHKELFTTGDIYAKIEEQKTLFEKSGRNALFAENIKLLESAKKPQLSMEHIHFGAKTTLAEEFTVPHIDTDGNKADLNLQESFILWAQNRTLENQDGRRWIDFATANISREELPENVSWSDIVNYIDGTPVKADALRGWRTYDMSEEEKKAEKAERKREADLKRQARSDTADRLFDRYLHEGLDDATRERLVSEYNRRFNSYIIPDYSKLPLFVDGMSAYKGETKFKLYDQQIKGISFLCNKGNGLLAYDVGVGKTAAGIVATVNQIQTGRSKRPLIVVPNQVYAKWYTDIRELFPNIKVNDLYNFNQESAGKYIDEKNPHKLNIPENSISLCTYEALKNITFTDESCENELFDDFSNLLSADFDGSDRENAQSTDKIKEIIGAASHVKDSSYYFFEDCGFDNLTVDEAHNFKNLWVVPRPKKKGASNEYSGIPSGKPSARALKLYGMTQLTQRNNDDRNVFLLTATPFTNSPTEVYSMLSYIGRKRLEESGLSSLRSFFDEFAKTKQELGVTSSGNIDTKQVMKNWKELPALQNILTEFIDKVDGEEAGIIRPNKFTHVKPLDMSPLQKQMREIDEERMAEVKEGNSAAVIVAMNNMRLSCVAPALANPAMYPGVDLPPLSELVETSPKLKFVCDAIIDMYKGNPEKGQFMYVPLGKESHGIIKDYLVSHGIPKEAVEIINGEVNNTPEKKDKITSRFNDEKNPLKVLIGGKNTSEGIDLNGNSFVMYNCSLGWNPSETIQAEGRIWRQGNLQGNVHIVYPVMNDSIDSVLYQKHDEKRSRINELWNYKGDSLNVEDINPEDLKIELIKDPQKKAKLILTERTKESRAELSRTELKIRSFDEIVERRKSLSDDFENAKDMIESYKSQSERYKAEGLEVPEWIKSSMKEYTKQQKQAETKLEVINEKLESLGIKNDDDMMKYIRGLNTQKKVAEEKIKNIEKEMPEIIRKLQKERLEQKLTEYPVEKQREILEADILNNLRPMKEVAYEVKTVRFEKMLSQKLKANDITQSEFDLYKKAGFENYEKWQNGEIDSLENLASVEKSERHVTVQMESEKAKEKPPVQNSFAQAKKAESKQNSEIPAKKSKKNAEQKSIYDDEGSLFFGLADEKLVVASTERNYKKLSEKSFSEQVDEVLAGTYDRFNALKVSDTPQILLDVGCKQLPILYTQNHLKNAMHAKSSNNPNWHGLTAEQIKQLPELLAKPAILMDSLSNANRDSLVAVLNAVDNDNAPLFAVIKPNGFETYEYELVDSNFMLSVYGKDNGFEKYIENAVKQDKILFWDKKESQALFSVLQLQLPQGLNKLDSDKILHQSNSLVNPNVVRSPAKNYFNSRNDDFSLTESQLLKSEQKRDEIIFPVLNGKESGMYKAFNDFAKRGVFDVQGTKVDVSDGNKITQTGWSQLHAAMNIYRSKEFETMRYVLIDKKSGEIRDQMALTSHMPNFCAVSDFAGKSLDEIALRAQKTNCLVAAVHNHPSGNITESRQDAEFTAFLEKKLNADGRDLFAGHIILDHGTFNLYTPEKGWAETFDFASLRNDDELLNKDFGFSSERTETTFGLENIARKINSADNWSDNFVPVVFSTAENEVTGIKLYDKSFFDRTPGQIRNEFQFSGLEAGAVNAFPVVTKNLMQSLSAIDAMLLEDKMKNLVHQNAFTDVALPDSTVVEKYNIKPGLPFFDEKNYKAKNPEIKTTWETRINPSLFTEKSEFTNQKEQMSPRQFQKPRLKKAAGMEY